MSLARWVLVALASWLIVGAPVSSARESSGIVGVEAVADPGTSQISLEPKCPHKTRAIGGGYSSWGIAIGNGTDPPITVALEAVYESRRASNRAWRSSAVLLRNPAAPPTAAGPNPFSAWSYCKPFKGKVRASSATGSSATSAAQSSTARASCPKRSVALSGGFSTTPLPGPGLTYPAIYESFRSGQRAWMASAVPGSQPSVSITSYAYCIHAIRPPMKRRHTKAQSGIVSSDPCPKGLQVGAGGFRTPLGGAVGFSEATNEPNRQVFPGTAYRTGRSWIIQGGSPSNGPVTVFGYCS
jgi:hypothetical protein